MTTKNKRKTCTVCHHAAVPSGQYVCTPCCERRGYVTEPITTVCMDCGNRQPVTHHMWADGVTCLPCLALSEGDSLFRELQAATPGHTQKCHTCPNDAEPDYAGYCTECWWDDRPRPAASGHQRRITWPNERTDWGSSWSRPLPPAPKVPTTAEELTRHAYRAPSA